MKNKILKFALLASAASVVGFGAACVPQNVTLAPLSTNVGCEVAGVNFSNFTVTPSTATVLLNSAGVVGGNISLGFSINPGVTPPADVILGYKITGTTLGIGFNVLGTPSLSSIQFTELACSTQLCAGPGNVVYANIGNAGPVQSASATFATPQSVVWIKKDIFYTTPTSQLTDFTNTHAIPEPMTLSMMGAGLLALGLLRRKK